MNFKFLLLDTTKIQNKDWHIDLDWLCLPDLKQKNITILGEILFWSRVGEVETNCNN